MNTRKYPRTMEAAFGPGNRGNLHAKPAPMHPTDKIIAWIGATVLIVLFGCFFFG
jgi:hypothetical protein